MTAIWGTNRHVSDISPFLPYSLSLCLSLNWLNIFEKTNGMETIYVIKKISLFHSQGSGRNGTHIDSALTGPHCEWHHYNERAYKRKPPVIR